MIKTILLCLLLSACGANAAAIRAAEKKCIAADEASLRVKLAAGESDANIAVELTSGEVTCALEALGAKATPAVDAGV